MDGMADAVRSALQARREPDPQHAGAAALALGYAGLMDEAAPAGKYRKALAVLRRAVAGTLDPDEDDADEALATVALALADHSVASDLGPKLFQALTGLGLTVSARAGGVTPPAPKAADPLDEIKAKREARLAARAQ